MQRGSYKSAPVLLNMLNMLGKRDKMQGLLSILLLCNRFDNINNTGVRLLDSIHHMTLTYFEIAVVVLNV